MDNLTKAQQGGLSDAEACALLRGEGPPLAELLQAAGELRSRHKGRAVTFSRKVFIPLTTYCRDDCGYCTFKRDPGQPGAGYLSPEQVLAIARAGEAAGCREALFSLGDKPELRFEAAASELAALGHARTTDYLAEMCHMVARETGLLPHPNPGVMAREEMAMLRECSASMGLMLETTSARLCGPGMPHANAPDKRPGARLANLRFAGELAIPFTTGLLIGIGETHAERVATLRAIAEIHATHGHVQEVIVQNFRVKPGIPMAGQPEPGLEDLLRTIAVARLLLGGEMNIQAPPNLSPETYPRLLAAGINDWGGISPVTPDHINPEAPWPHLEELARQSAGAGHILTERLAVYPAYIAEAERWLHPQMRPRVLSLAGAGGLAHPHNPPPPEPHAARTA